MAPKNPKAPKDEFAEWVEWLKRELLIAAYAAAGLTAMFLIRRWTGSLLGAGLLSSEIFSGSGSLNDMITHVEEFVERKEKKDGKRPRPRADGARPSTNGGSDDA